MSGDHRSVYVRALLFTNIAIELCVCGGGVVCFKGLLQASGHTFNSVSWELPHRSPPAAGNPMFLGDSCIKSDVSSGRGGLFPETALPLSIRIPYLNPQACKSNHVGGSEKQAAMGFRERPFEVLDTREPSWVVGGSWSSSTLR